ncbi:MAG: SAM-dependent methyltransferase [Nocardioides sp.]
MTDWMAWHADYEDPSSDLSGRRRSVQACIRRWLDDAGTGPLQVVSACSGDGRDLLEVLATHQAAGQVRARLVELDDALASRAEDYAREQHLDGVEVARADAGHSDSYARAVPADLVMLCGVFGNLSDADTRATVKVARQLCSRGATVVWTRGRFADRDPVEPTDAIRRWFNDAGFELVSLHAPEDRTYRVGFHRLGDEPEPLISGQRFFTFTR